MGFGDFFIPVLMLLLLEMKEDKIHSFLHICEMRSVSWSGSGAAVTLCGLLWVGIACAVQGGPFGAGQSSDLSPVLCLVPCGRDGRRAEVW